MTGDKDAIKEYVFKLEDEFQAAMDSLEVAEKVVKALRAIVHGPYFVVPEDSEKPGSDDDACLVQNEAITALTAWDQKVAEGEL